MQVVRPEPTDDLLAARERILMDERHRERILGMKTLSLPVRRSKPLVSAAVRPTPEEAGAERGSSSDR